MENKFIAIFLEMISEFPNLLDALLRGESMHFTDLRMMGYDPKKIYKGFDNLKNRKIIRLDKKETFSFTKHGARWLKSAYLKKMRLLSPRWDHKWRVIIFDIPQELHHARNSFRRKLQTLGFFMLQKSIFVFPYSCEKDLGYICTTYKISDYVDVITAENIGSRTEHVKKFFNL